VGRSSEITYNVSSETWNLTLATCLSVWFWLTYLHPSLVAVPDICCQCDFLVVFGKLSGHKCSTAPEKSTLQLHFTVAPWCKFEVWISGMHDVKVHRL